MEILNLTQHIATVDQVNAGVIQPSSKHIAEIKQLLTFDELPSEHELCLAAKRLAEIANIYEVSHVMIGGFQPLMGYLEKALYDKGIIPHYSFTKRVIKEELVDNGVLVKTSEFKHMGFIPPIF